MRQVNDLYVYLGARLKEERENQGERQAHIAQALGKTDSWVSLVERGEQRLYICDLLHWCFVLGIDPGDIMEQVLEDDPLMM